MPRSTRTLIAIMLWIVAVFLVMGHITSGAPLGDWWLALLLVVVGLLLWFLPDGSAAASAEIDTHDAMLTHTQERTDALASAASTGDATLQDPVENISTSPGTTLAETGELSGPPGSPVSHADEPAPAPTSTPVSTPTPTPAASPPVEPVQPVAETGADPDTEEEAVTEERSDAIAAEATPSTEELTGTVENISTDPTATLEESGEVSGPPSSSIDREPTETEPQLTEPEMVDDEKKEYEEHSTVTAEGEIVGTVNITGNRQSVIREDDPRVDPEVVEDVEVDDSIESTTIEEKEATLDQAATAAPADPTVGEDDHDVPSEPEIDPQPAPAEDRQPDDLKRIEGIGPKMSRALIAAGIDTFVRLSNASEDEIRAAIVAAGMRFAPSVPTWARQADYAAAGDWDGLAAYQATLSSGRSRSDE